MMNGCDSPVKFFEERKVECHSLGTRLIVGPRDEADLDDIACECESLATAIRNWFFMQGEGYRAETLRRGEEVAK